MASSVYPGIVVSLYASAHHPYTTVATGEWMIFWPSEDSPVEVGPTECSRHLEIRSSLHVRLLPATLQYACTSVHTLVSSWDLEWSILYFDSQRHFCSKEWVHYEFSGSIFEGMQVAPGCVMLRYRPPLSSLLCYHSWSSPPCPVLLSLWLACIW